MLSGLAPHEHGVRDLAHALLAWEVLGGPRREAEEGAMFVLRADGGVVSNGGGGWFSAKRLNGFRPLPGDAIVVPEDLYRTTLTKDLKDWTQIFYQFGLGAAALKVIRD